MSDIYTRLLGRHYATLSENVVIYTAPATGTTVVRDLVVSNSSVAAADCLVYLNDPGGSYTLFRGPIGQLATQHLDLRQVMKPGDQIYAFSASSSWSVTVSGYVFD